MKQCSKCKQQLPITSFHKNGIGYRSECKPCRSKSRSVINRIVDGARHRAKTKNLPFDIDYNFIKELNYRQKGLCALTGVTLNWTPGGGNSIQRSCPIDRASLDKKIPTLGYTRDNVQLVTDFANRMKSMYSQDELIAFCKRVSSQF